MKTNEEYILEAVDLAWRWYVTKDRKNSVDSGIRCMDVDDPWIISTDDIRLGHGPGITVLARQLAHQEDRNLPNAMTMLRELIDGGNVVSKTLEIEDRGVEGLSQGDTCSVCGQEWTGTL